MCQKCIESVKFTLAHIQAVRDDKASENRLSMVLLFEQDNLSAIIDYDELRPC